MNSFGEIYLLFATFRSKDGVAPVHAYWPYPSRQPRSLLVDHDQANSPFLAWWPCLRNQTPHMLVYPVHPKKNNHSLLVDLDQASSLSWSLTLSKQTAPLVSLLTLSKLTAPLHACPPCAMHLQVGYRGKRSCWRQQLKESGVRALMLSTRREPR